MTQTSQIVREVFAGDDTANPITTQIPFYISSDLILFKEVSGATTPLVDGVDYNITGGGGSGGTITPTAAIPDGTNWVVYRSLPKTQQIDLENQGAILPSAIEEALDRAVLSLLDQGDQTDRSVKANPGEINPTGLEMPDLATRASKILQWDAQGNIGSVDPLDILPDTLTISAFMQTVNVLTTWPLVRSALKIEYGLLSNRPVPTTLPDGQIYFTTDTGEFFMVVSGAWLLMSASQETIVKPNLIVNGSMQIDQRVTHNSGSTFKNDDWQLCLDQILLVSDGNNAATVTQETVGVPDNFANFAELKCATTAKKHGFLFPLDSLMTKQLLTESDDGKASFRFWRRAPGFGTKSRAALLSWQGTADVMTDPVNDGNWGAEGVLPTLNANWTLEGSTALSTTPQVWDEVTLENIAIDTANTKNVALMIWQDDLDLTAGVSELRITGVHLNAGASLAPYVHPSFVQEWNACQKYFYKTFPYATEPGQNKGTDGVIVDGSFIDFREHKGGVNIRFPAPMFENPVITFYNPSAANANWRNLTQAQDEGSAVALYPSTLGFFAQHPNLVDVTVNDLVGIHFIAFAAIVG